MNGGWKQSYPDSARDLWRAARQLGLARNTVLRAKRKLNIRHTRILTPSGWTGYWLLPGQEVCKLIQGALEEYPAEFRHAFSILYCTRQGQGMQAAMNCFEPDLKGSPFAILLLDLRRRRASKIWASTALAAAPSLC